MKSLRAADVLSYVVQPDASYVRVGLRRSFLLTRLLLSLLFSLLLLSSDGAAGLVSSKATMPWWPNHKSMSRRAESN